MQTPTFHVQANLLQELLPCIVIRNRDGDLPASQASWHKYIIDVNSYVQ